MALTSERRRAHVVLPADLIQEIDALVGRRGRSQFLEAAAADRLKRLRRVVAFERAIATSTESIPEWETRESTAKWLNELRQDRDLGDWYERPHSHPQGEG